MDYIEIKQQLALEYAKAQLQKALIHNPTKLPNNVDESDFFARDLANWYNDCYEALGNYEVKDTITT